MSERVIKKAGEDSDKARRRRRQEVRDAAWERAKASRRAQGLPERMDPEIMKRAAQYCSEIGLTARFVRPPT